MTAPFDGSNPSVPFKSQHQTQRFVVHAQAAADIMSRLLEEFCKRSLTPDSWHMDRDPSASEQMTIHITIFDMDGETARKMAAALRRHHGVEYVLYMEKP